MKQAQIHNAADFGWAVRATRKEAGLSQTQLAERCGCSQRFVSEVERGKPTAEIGKALRLLDELGEPMMAGNSVRETDGRAEVRHFIARLESDLEAGRIRKRSLSDYLGAERDR